LTSKKCSACIYDHVKYAVFNVKGLKASISFKAVLQRSSGAC